MAIEIRILQKIYDKNRKDTIRNVTIIENLNIKNTKVKEKIEEGQLRWYGNANRMSDDEIVKQVFELKAGKKKSRQTPEKKWMKEVTGAEQEIGITQRRQT